MNGMKVFIKIADSAAKHYNCRLKYDDKTETAYYIGPENRKDYILEEVNKYLKHIGLVEIDMSQVKFLRERAI